MKPDWSRHLAAGALAGLLLAWLIPGLLGPPISAYAPELRDNPRLSDAVMGAGGLLIYLSEAPVFYVGAHLNRSVPAADLVNALGWTLIGLTTGGLIAAIRSARGTRGSRETLAAGALGGLLLGWMIPSLCLALGEAFRHCWMHEGLLGTLALLGGTTMRAVAVLAELPWRLLAGPSEGITPVVAMPVSAVAWTLFGLACAAALLRARGWGRVNAERLTATRRG